jgi:hypothetical protein
MDIMWQIVSVLGGLQVVLAASIGFLAKIQIARMGIEQTATLERIGNEQRAALQRELAHTTSELSRDRAVIDAERHRIVTHLEKLTSAYAELLVLIRLANRVHWLFSQKMVNLERAFIGAYYGLNIQLQILCRIEAVPEEATSDASRALYQVRDAWDELTFRLGQYKSDMKLKEESESSESFKKISAAAAMLHQRTSPLEKSVEALTGAVRLPR